MLAITNGTILTGTGESIENGLVLVEDGKIAYVGLGPTPSGAQVIDAGGKFVSPGLFDAHTHIGISEGGGWEGLDANERSEPVGPHLRAIDAINPADPAFTSALENGITTVVVSPGSSNVISGTSVVVKTVGSIVDKMIVREPAGLKAALGENPKRAYTFQRRSPMTRMGSAGLLRKSLNSAKSYLNKTVAAQANNQHPPDRDLRMESICRVLKKEMPLRIHVHRADDIITALRIGEEFGLDLVLEHGTEAHFVVEQIQHSNTPVVFGPVLSSPSKVETKGRTFSTLLKLLSVGARVALTTDHPITHISQLQTAAIRSIRAGVSSDDALRMVTIYPAEICGVANRLGSLERGKDADIVIWSGHPMDFMSTVHMVFVDGEDVYHNGVN